MNERRGLLLIIYTVAYTSIETDLISERRVSKEGNCRKTVALLFIVFDASQRDMSSYEIFMKNVKSTIKLVRQLTNVASPLQHWLGNLLLNETYHPNVAG